MVLLGINICTLMLQGPMGPFFTRLADTLRQQGLTPARCLAFADHHAFTAADLPADADAVVITSKDAVKWQALDNGKLWVLPVTAQLDAGLVSWLVSTLKELRHGQQAA
mgnify:CR=1 FL=1